MKALRLEVIFGAKNKLSPALKIIVGSSNAASKALKKTNDQLKDLERQQNKIATFRKLKDDVKQATAELDKTNRKIAAFKQQLVINPNAQLSAELKKAEAEARRLNKVVTEGRPKLLAMRRELDQTGLRSSDLAKHQESLKTKIHGANQEIDKQKQRLQNLNRIQQSTQKMASNARTAGMYGVGAAATGVGAMYQLRKPIHETKHMDVEENRIASLGLGKEATKEAIEYAKAMETFGTSTLDNLQLVRDGVTAFADVHHAQMVAPTLAKMKFANEAMYGDSGAENEKKFMDMLKVIEMRNGLKSEQAFQEQANIIQQVITATGGRVQAEEWLNVIKTGGIAAKGIDNQAFYYKLEPLVQEMGGFRVGTAMMSAYQNVYQGRTTKRAANNLMNLGLIEDPSKLKHDKSGQISFLDVGAIKGAALFKKDQFAWMEQVLVPQLKAKGITKEGDIIDAMGSIFTNRTASNLFAQMYLQREQIHKNAKLNAGADNIEQLNTKAMGTTMGKELEARAKLHDTYLGFGTTILPVYTKAIETATEALRGFNGWMERNPALAKMLGMGVLGIAASLIVIGGTLAVFSPLILGMLSLRLIMASFTGTTAMFSRGLSVLPAIFNVVKFAVFGLGRIFLAVSRLFLMNPIGLAITAIAVAAYLIYKNWEPVKGFFKGIWSTITTAFNGGIKGVSALIINWSPIGLFYSAFAKVMSWFGIELPAKFTGFGGMIIDGLISGIKNGFAKLKGIWASINAYMPSFMQKSMDIHSPSRVMAGLGRHIMSGLGVGLQNGFPDLKAKFSDVVGIFSPNTSELIQKINIEPALAKIRSIPVQTAAASDGAITIQGDTITMHIHAQPGQSVQQIAQVVANMLDQRDRQKMQRVRDRYQDSE
ncbi:MAG: phage tail tape measure protein [Acinetobacter sp.]|uniref:phage tail tape measure protein n=1 Tax=Acinetobacter sp. TaxID=472 RepID=UPI00391B93C0